MEEAKRKGTFEQTKREMDATDSIIQIAEGIKDPVQKQAYLQQEYDKYLKAGYKLPKGLLIPGNHTGMRQAIRRTTEHMRELEKQEEKARLDELRARGDRASREKVAAGNQAATVNAAKLRATASGDKMTPAIALAIFSDPNADPNDPRYQHAVRYLMIKAQERLQVNNIPLGMGIPYLEEIYSEPDPVKREAIDRKYRDKILRLTNPHLFPGDPRTSGGQIGQGGGQPPPQDGMQPQPNVVIFERGPDGKLRPKQ